MSQDTESRKSLKRRSKDDAPEAEQKKAKSHKKRKHADITDEENVNGGVPIANGDVVDTATATEVEDKAARKQRRKAEKEAKKAATTAEESVLAEDEEKPVKKSKKSKKDKDIESSNTIAPTTDVEMADVPVEEEEKSPKKAKKSKKDKTEDDIEKPTTSEQDIVITAQEAEKPAKKSKKDKKQTSFTAPTESTTDASTTPAISDKEAEANSTDQKSQKSKKEGKKPKSSSSSTEDVTATAIATDTPDSKHRYICFIGNLPFTATADHVRAHFSSLAPTSVRLSTDKATHKPRGFAFVEFASYDRMKTALKLMHHSEFADPSAPDNPKKTRRINVELTAGGGGNTEGRMEKVKAKNVRLEEQRERRRVEEAKVKERKEKKDEKAAKGRKGADGAEGGKEEEKKKDDNDMTGVHPNRIAMVNAANAAGR